MIISYDTAITFERMVCGLQRVVVLFKIYKTNPGMVSQELPNLAWPYFSWTMYNKHSVSEELGIVRE